MPQSRRQTRLRNKLVELSALASKHWSEARAAAAAGQLAAEANARAAAPTEAEASMRRARAALERREVDADTFPERRVESGALGTAPVAQVLADLANASLCGAFVGTFTSSLSKIVFASQVSKQASK